MWKPNFFDKSKQEFFEAVEVSGLQYSCTIWILMKRLRKKLDGNYTRMLASFLEFESSTLQDSRYPATHLMTHEPLKKSKQDIRGSARMVRANS